MFAQTLETTAHKKDLIQAIELLSDKAVLQVKGYIERLREEEELAAIDAEIAMLEAKHGTTPNAETIAAMKEAEAGIGEKCTLEEAIAEIHALA